MLNLYPFAAVVGGDPDTDDGLDDMALALILSAINPAIGGVLIRGEKGTAKSTLVRALAGVLPPIEVVAGDRFSSDPADPEAVSPDGVSAAQNGIETRPVRLVELPVGATEDRLVGSIHLERALSHGQVDFEPGLLAKAHRGILYVDEVNLLHDHLVDLLLDAAAMGRLSVERDGISVTHAARFVLVGTMNPEEGELRPQLLDRFGLTVEVSAPEHPARRVEVVRRRLDYDSDPAGFRDRYATAETRLRDRIQAAKHTITEVELTDSVLLAIAEVCSAFGVDGMRADIVTARTAAAHAAWHGRSEVTSGDVRVAARLALPHRRRRNPFDSPGIDETQLDELLAPETPHDDPEPDPDPDGPGGGASPSTDDDHGGQSPADAPARPQRRDPDISRRSDDAAPEPSDPDTESARPRQTLAQVNSGAPFRTRLLRVAGIGDGDSGRRSRARTTTGRRVGASTVEGAGVHLLETMRAAAPHQRARGRTGGPIRLRGEDLRRAIREGQESNLVLFVVDTSGSMAVRERLRQVKTAVLSILLDAYRRRDRVALVTFRGSGAEVALPATRSVEAAAARLESLPVGGRTPLAEGLIRAVDVARVEKLRDPARRHLLVILTDGRATSGRDAVPRSRHAAAVLAASGLHAVVVDCESGFTRLGLARPLADHMRADYVSLDRISADALTDIVDGATKRGAA
ncbi:VWA domain-containing protein [Gordonia sp. ABSL11-1]|uniref:VWA domain-containing protein n=1 Tax=Gordonia sp. ABSL11-1 TaxID=3053924 RepID=UPI00257412BF|nr:VWA domain-containing protein [Gordonia sp. ABSL11-1]MDL9948476.1 VWA domain-containing protein [Gordonia sp. ABSL11-1]